MPPSETNPWNWAEAWEFTYLKKCSLRLRYIVKFKNTEFLASWPKVCLSKAYANFPLLLNPYSKCLGFPEPLTTEKKKFLPPPKSSINILFIDKGNSSPSREIASILQALTT